MQSQADELVPELTASIANGFAAWVWQNREQFKCKPLTATEAVRQAVAALEKQGRLGSNEISRPMTMDECDASLSSPDQGLVRTFAFLPDIKAARPVTIAE